ncbi:hypothetical protein MRX33_10215 [Pseudomonas sp. JI-2]|nr:hypothetical protein [Pseudomonas sp. JI-2]
MTSLTIARSAEIIAFSELMSAGAARSLDLLKAIDGTIDSVTHHCQLLEVCEGALRKAIAAINEGLNTEFDEEQIVPVLEGLQESLASALVSFERKRKAALLDPRLKGSDGVVDAYDCLISAALSLNEAAEELRWAILEHNADMEGPHEAVVLSDDDEIAAFLKAL